MRFLVTGGAGYIGSEFVRTALAAKKNVCIVDDLSRGHKYNVPDEVEFHQVNLLQTKELSKIIANFNPTTIVHFAGYALVGESANDPLLYYRNNLEGTVSLLKALDGRNCNIVFSSSCAVYGTPQTVPIAEDTEQAPLSPYGWSKKMCEQVIMDFCQASGSKAYLLRYFNACGAALDSSFGEDHDPETHLIPNVIKAFMDDKPVTIHGDDYKTDDGTCIRDYIHTTDLADAHLKAAAALEQAEPGFTSACNLGTGQGYSVKEVVHTVASVMDVSGKSLIGERRPGDPPKLFANTAKAQRELGFKTQHSDLKTIIETAVKWHRKKGS